MLSSQIPCISCFFRVGFQRHIVKKKDKNPNAVALGKLGAKARLEKLTPEQRRAIAQKAIRARWAKEKKKQSD